MDRIRLDGSKMRRRRIQKGLSQEDLAELADVSQTWVTRVENDKYDPQVSDMKRVAKVLDCRLDDLL